MAHDALAFLDAVELNRVDLLGFSLGSFVAREIALIRPGAVRRMVLAASAPQRAAGMHGWARDVIDAVGAPNPQPDAYLGVFYTSSPESRTAGQESLQRMFARTADRDATTWRTRMAQRMRARSRRWAARPSGWRALALRQRRWACSRRVSTIQRIRDYVEHWNTNAQPFAWTATADEILARVSWVEANINNSSTTTRSNTNRITRQ